MESAPQVDSMLSIVPESAQEGSGGIVQLQPLNIHFHYTLSSNTSEDDQTYLKNRLLPATAAVLRQFIQVRRPPADGVLRLTPPCEDGWKVCDDNSHACKTPCKKWAEMKCGKVPLPLQHLDALETCEASAAGVSNCTSSTPGAGVETDLIIYVTNENQCWGDNTERLASSLLCASDTLTYRPVAGGIDFCNFGRHRFQDDLMVAVHEMIHILGMSSKFFNISSSINGEAKFVDKELNLMQLSDVVESYTSAKGRTRHRIVTPAVKAAARRHFNCETLQGAPLEDDLGHGSAGSHWDQRLFQGEIMDPVAGQDTVVGRHVVTNLTLALLEDTGWYSIDYRAAGFNHWGYLAGCEFAESSVKEVKASTDSAVQRFTCQRELSATTECTVDLTSLGVCIADANFDGLPHVQEDSPEQACLRSDTQSFAESEANYGQYHGPGCYKTLCKGEEYDRQLYVEFEGTGVQVPCPPGAFVDLSSIEGLDFTGKSLLGPCPDREVLCGRGQEEQGLRECGDSDCAANGDCLRGRCHCHIGYVGPACGSRICTGDEDCATGTMCHWSGQCLTAEEGTLLQFQAVTPLTRTQTVSEESSRSLTDAAKLSIMASMGILLLIIASVCAYLLLRNRQNSQRGVSAIAPSSTGRGAQSGRSTLQLPESGTPPRTTPRGQRSSSSRTKQSPLSKSHKKNSGTSAAPEEQWQNRQELSPVPIDAMGCPMSM